MVHLSTLTVERLGTVGAEVRGVERSQLVDDDALPARCMEALEEHGVLVFRELHVDDDTQVVFSQRLDDVGKAVPVADYLRGTFAWHIDGAQDEVPTKATVLSAKVVATTGGETEFASTYAAYDELGDDEKVCFEGVRVFHSFEASQRREPNRFRNYLGSARAAEMAGDRAKAASYYQKLVTLAKDADTARPELVSAKKLAQL